MALALGFDLGVSKDTPLRLFLNRAYFGSVGHQEVLGLPAAARRERRADSIVPTMVVD